MNNPPPKNEYFFIRAPFYSRSSTLCTWTVEAPRYSFLVLGTGVFAWGFSSRGCFKQPSAGSARGLAERSCFGTCPSPVFRSHLRPELALSDVEGSVLYDTIAMNNEVEGDNL
jgi:hypothetical protein